MNSCLQYISKDIKFVIIMIKFQSQNPVTKLLGQKKQVVTYFNVEESELPKNPLQKMVSKFKRKEHKKNMVTERLQKNISFQNYCQKIPLIYTEFRQKNVSKSQRSENSMQKLRRIYSQQKNLKMITKRLFMNYSDKNDSQKQVSCLFKKNGQRYRSFTKILQHQCLLHSNQNRQFAQRKGIASQDCLNNGLKHQKLGTLKNKLISSKRQQGAILQRRKALKKNTSEGMFKQNINYVNTIEQQDIVNGTDISNSQLDMSPYLN